MFHSVSSEKSDAGVLDFCKLLSLIVDGFTKALFFLLMCFGKPCISEHGGWLEPCHLGASRNRSLDNYDMYDHFQTETRRQRTLESG